jgi:uncharacterized protein YndB with AHSA1/START domain
MGTIHESITIHADPATVWDLAGDPARIADWMPAIAASTADGDRRFCTLQDGGDLAERIIERSDEERFYEYEVLEGPMPVSSYRSRLSVEGHDEHSHVDWEAEFAPQEREQEQELTEMVSGLYREGLDSLRERLESREPA